MTGVPRRVRVIGDLFHGRPPAGAVYVGRGMFRLTGSLFANPHRVGKPCRAEQCAGVVHTRPEAVEAHREDLRQDRDLIRRAYAELRGHDLACWCPEDAECHADTWCAIVRLLEIADDTTWPVPLRAEAQHAAYAVRLPDRLDDEYVRAALTAAIRERGEDARRTPGTPDDLDELPARLAELRQRP